MKDSTTVQDKITITMRKQKEIRDDRVAVITSPVGWWTEYHNYDLLFDPILVNWIEQIEQIYLKEEKLVWDIEIERICKLMEDYLTKEYPDFQFPPAIGLSLNIQWVSVGEKFRIVERYRYGEWDETVELLTDTQWLDA